MTTRRQIIYLHPAAPLKPAPGAPCNGCGVCCAMETCPLARLLLLQWRGPCRALQWRASSRRYVCGMMDNPAPLLPLLPRRLEPWLRAGARRWIAAGIGCDAHVEIEPAHRNRPPSHDNHE